MSRQDIIFETDSFNLSEEREHFINPCCFGEDLLAWLQSELAAKGIRIDEPGQEDWGWYSSASVNGALYFIGVSGHSREDAGAPDLGEWRIMVERKRSFWDKISGKNRMAEPDPFVEILHQVISSIPNVMNIRRE
jgi:hypothetical protein